MERFLAEHVLGARRLAIIVDCKEPIKKLLVLLCDLNVFRLLGG